MPTIQRPTEAATALFWRAPRAALPVGTPLVVDAKECVVASLDGAILGVIPPGAHTLHPQSFPFLARCVDASSSITAELWFVRTTECAGLEFGGPVGTVYDATTELRVSPRVWGEFSIRVIDPARFVSGSTSMTDVDALFRWVGGIVLNEAKEAIEQIAAQGTFLMSPVVLARVSEEVTKPSGHLDSVGLAVGRVGNVAINFSDDDQKALKSALAVKAAAKRAEKLAEMAAHERAVPAASAGASGSASPPGVASAPTPGGGAAASPARKSKGMLGIGLGLAGVVVLAFIVAVTIHFMHEGSTDKSPASHETKHGKH